MIGVIIAGGKGTRLKHLTRDIPKPMIRIGNKPVIEHQIELLKEYGVTKVYIMLGHMGHLIKEYFKDGERWRVEIKYNLEHEPLGTAGCIKEIEDKINDDFLVLYGDLMLYMKLDDLIEFHKSKKAVATLVVHPNDHPYDSDLVIVDDGYQIKGFLSKDRNEGYYRNLVNAAVYVLSRKVFEYIPKGKHTDFVKDIFPEMLKKSERFIGYKTAEYIKDVGTLDRLDRVKNDYDNNRIRNLSKDFKRPAVFMDRDGTLIEDIHLLTDVDALRLYSFTPSAIKKLNASEFLSILITNQPVVARGLCDMETVGKVHDKIETLLGMGKAYLDGIYFCPHHPDKGYDGENKDYKVNCDCRKPKTGMIERAVKEYNIDVTSSWLIGDSTVDIQTGINAGMQTILVKTGKGGKDGKYIVSSDFISENLREAVDFILTNRKVNSRI